MSLSEEQLLEPFAGAVKPVQDFRVGIEAEKFGVVGASCSPLPYASDRPESPSIEGLFAALCERFGYKRKCEVEGGPTIALSRGRAQITLEPGGQLELSGTPLEDVHAVAQELSVHYEELASVGSHLGVRWLGIGFHPFARPEDLPWVPKLRYGIMRAYFPTRGARGLDMMRRTATVQANFDFSSEQDAMRKLRLGLKVSPIVGAMAAHAPFYEGGQRGYLSERLDVWLSVDPERQGLIERVWSPKAGWRDYVAWALDAPMFLFRRGDRIIANTGQPFRAFLASGYEGHRATMADWDAHLSTLFPEVRLKRTLEVRGADSLPGHLCPSLPALYTGLFYDERALAEAEDLTESFRYDEMQALRPRVAKEGLMAPFRGRPVVEVALRVLEIAEGGLRRRARLDAMGRDETVHLRPLAEGVERGLCPANRLLADLPSDPAARRAAIVQRTQLGAPL